MLHIVMTADCLKDCLCVVVFFNSAVGPGIMNLGTVTIIMHLLRVEFLLIHLLVIRIDDLHTYGKLVPELVSMSSQVT